MNSVSIPPRIWPHDAIDVLIGLPLGVLFGGVLPLGVAWAFGFGLGYLGLRLGAFIGAAGVYLAFAVLLICWTVRRLEITHDGIRFVRVVGSPKFIPWGHITDVSPAPRNEVVRLGWLAFPFREASLALTAMGHYRFRFGAGLQYFPPRNPDEFEKALQTFREAAQQAHLELTKREEPCR